MSLLSSSYFVEFLSLGAPRSGKVDMWSAGCIIAEMLAGRRLYPGNTLQEQLYIINKCQGPIPGRILMRGFNTPRFYNRTSNGGFEMKVSNVNLDHCPMMKRI